LRAAVATRYGGPEVLEIRDVPAPEPAAGEVVARVRAIGLNFADLFARMGVYPLTPPPPFVPGLEFSGEVVSCGPGAGRFRPGDRIMGYSRHGSHAELVSIHEAYAVPVPPALSFHEAAAFLATGLTAYHGLFRLAHLCPGERLLVHAAAGGVGLASVQLGRAVGAEVFATAGTEVKTALARKEGATHVINYRREDFETEIRRLTGGEGVDVVMDSVGGRVYRKSWRLLAPMGRYVLFGVSAVTGSGGISRLKAARVFGQMPLLFPPSLIGANKGLFGFNLGTLHGKEAYFEKAIGELLEWHRKGGFRPVVGEIFSFDRIVEAHRHLQLGRSVGKVVVVFEQPELPHA
jgi:NADPH:quinone reductase-like Zn-dependent oxidoreductase